MLKKLSLVAPFGLRELDQLIKTLEIMEKLNHGNNFKGKFLKKLLDLANKYELQ